MEILKLMRVNQWYKNFIVFLPIIFSVNLFNIELLIKSILIFLSLCFMSSVNYIINDIKDFERDKKHKIKKYRPIPSGRVSKRKALFFAIILFLLSIFLSYITEPLVIIWPICLFISSSIYTLKLKKFPIIDINIIALNFLIRVGAGSYSLNIYLSPWMFILVYFLSLYLALGKRRAEIEIVRNYKEFKEVLTFYNKDMLNYLMVSVLSIFISVYSMYTFIAHPNNNLMMITIPIVSFTMFRYYYLTFVKKEVAERTELIFTDKQITLGVIIWLVVSIYIFYFF